MKRVRPGTLVLWGLLLLSILINLIWHSYTGFIRDDAFITFRYASNIAGGHGFTYNLGENVYGTSSPGLALIMAAWLTFSNNPVIGSLILDIMASVIALYYVWNLLEDRRITDLQRALIIFILIWSDKVLLHFMEGMESPLVVSCMLASLYYMTRDRPIAAGIVAGLMLWFRLDSALWVPVLAVVFVYRQRYIFKDIFIFLLITSLVYLPWLIFAWSTFGTIIPQTAIAKQVAYGLSMQPWNQRAAFLFWFTPFTLLIDPLITRAIAVLTIGISLFGAWTWRGSSWVRALVLFLILQSAALVALNMTVEQRYYVTAFYVMLILFGLGLITVYRRLDLRWTWGAGLFAIYAVSALAFALPRVQHMRDQQLYVYGTLANMGTWLRENSAPGSFVYLEPLGYVGYYSERFMLDDVGFVTPAVVPLKRGGLDSFILAHYLQPDYIVLHCDDAKRAPAGYPYLLAVRFDPLDFESGNAWHDAGVQRNACYQINKK